MKYTVYKTTNDFDEMYYIGVHQTNDPYDNYLGSGDRLNNAIDKYGEEHFSKEILHIFDNPKEMFEMEKTLVDKNDPNSYNVIDGGNGGWDSVNDNPKTEDHRKNIGLSIESKWSRGDYDHLGDELFGGIRNAFTGKHHTKASKDKIGRGGEKRYGKSNGSYGTMWITNESESKKIGKNDSIPEGWRKGRKIKIN